MNRRQRSRVAAVVGVMLFLLQFTSCESSRRMTIKIGAMPPGTSWYVFGATLARLLEAELPEDIAVEVVARGGAAGNPIVVDRGDVTIAIAQVATASWAAAGEEHGYKNRQCRNIRALVGGLNSVWLAAMLREEYIERTGNDTLAKALQSDAPLRIVMKPAGSSVPVLADMVMEILGTSREKIRAGGGEIIQVTANQIPSLLRDGRADLYFESPVRGHPTVTEVTTTAEVRFAELPPVVVEQLARKGLKPGRMPKWFKGQTGPLASVDMGTVLIAHQNLPDDLAYLITKTVCENKNHLATAHKAWGAFDPATAGRLDMTGIPLHPGAKRYYEEKGWL